MSARQSDDRRLFARLSRLVAALFGGEPNDPSAAHRHAGIEALLARSWSLTDDQLQVLIDAWLEEDPQLRKHAWRNARALIDHSDDSAILDHVRQELGDWAQARGNDFQGLEGLLGSPAASARGRQAAAPAILDKAAAILGGDALDEADRALLARPWDSLR